VIIEYLKRLNQGGMTIIYTSHYMEEAQQLCSLIAVIDQGKIIIQGKPSELISSRPGNQNLESIFLQLTGRNLRDQ
jgi:ABC-2 type transport system ATP-binding protein